MLGLPLLAWGSIAATGEAGTWVVAQDGSGDFQSLQIAIDSVAQGDVLLLKSGIYGGASIDAKGLELVALNGAGVVTDALRISNLGPSQRISLSGFAIQSTTGGQGNPSALTVTDCEGAVWCQDLRVGTPDFSIGNGVSVKNSQNVAFTHSTIVSRHALGPAVYSFAGMWILNSQVSLYASILYGPQAVSSQFTNGEWGIVCRDSLLFMSDSVVHGGGGFGCDGDYCCSYTGVGGTGMKVMGTTTVYRNGSRILGGKGGCSSEGFYCKFCEADGRSIVIQDAGQVLSLGETTRTWSCDNHATRGGAVSVVYEGVAYDKVYAMRSSASAFLINPGQGGLDLIGPGGGAAYLGTAGPGGLLLVDLDLQEITPDGSAAGFFLQVMAVDTSDAIRLSGPGHLALLDFDPLPACSEIIYVDVGGSPGASGQSWAEAMPDLHLALSIAEERYGRCEKPAEIWVAEGTYKPASGSPTDGFAFVCNTPVRLFGGFAGVESSPDQRDIAAHPTILTADRLGDDGANYANVNDNSSGVFASYSNFAALEIPGKSRFDGLTFTGAREYGAVFYVQLPADRSPAGVSFEQCTFVGNRSQSNDISAGLQCWTGWVDINHCTFSHNSSDAGGPTVTLDSPRIAVQNSRFESNKNAGGAAQGILAVSNYHGMGPGKSIYLGDCRFLENHTDGSVINIWAKADNVEISGCTLFANTSDDAAAAIRTLDYADPFVRISNSILWGNRSQSGPDDWIPFAGGGDWFITRSCVEGTISHPASNNIHSDPLLDPGGNLSPGSPCIDAADNRLVHHDIFDLDHDGDVAEPLPYDILNKSRFVDDPNTTDTGAGPGPLADMGASELQIP